MAFPLSLQDLLEPAQTAPQPPQTPEAFEYLKGQWNSFLSNPDNRAGLLSFGINMMSPMAPGGGFFSALGQSLGAAGETIDRRVNQREDVQTERFRRATGVADLGLRERGFREDVRSRGVTERQNERQLDISQQNADSALLSATDSSRSITDNKYLTEASKARAIYQDMVSDVFRDESIPIQPWTEFWTQYATDLGLDPNYQLGGPQGGSIMEIGVDTALPAEAPGSPAPVPAGTPAPAPAPGPVPSVGPTTNQFRQTNPDQWNMVITGLQSTDPQQNAKAQMALQLLAQRVSDPLVLKQLVEAVLKLPGPGPVVAPVGPKGPPTPPVGATPGFRAMQGR